jgi:hypothetical protein
MNNDQINPQNQSSSPQESPVPMPFQSSAPQGPEPVVPVPKQSKKKLIIGIIVAAIFVILAAGSVLAYTFWYQNPDKVVADGIMNAIKAKSLTYTGTLNANSDDMKLKLAIDGAAGGATGNVNVKATFDMESKPVTLSGGGLIDKDGTLYFKVKNVGEIVAPYRATMPKESQTMLDQLIAKVDDRWIKISADDMKEFSEESSKTQKCFTDTLNKFKDDKKATGEVADIYKKHKFLTIEQNLGSQGGSLGYSVKANKEAGKAFASDMKNTRIYKSMQDCDKDFKLDTDDVTADSQKADESKVEVWVERWSHEITKIVVKDDKGPDTADMTLEPRFNKPVNVTAPEKSVTLTDLKTEIEGLVQSFYVGSATQQPTSMDL